MNDEFDVSEAFDRAERLLERYRDSAERIYVEKAGWYRVVTTISSGSATTKLIPVDPDNRSQGETKE